MPEASLLRAHRVPRIKRLYQPGDILGFSECGPVGIGINLCTYGIPGWGLSHVGIVALHPRLAIPILYESTSLYDEPCILEGHRVNGVQAHWIRPRIAAYPGRVWHYPLLPMLRLSLDESCHLTTWLVEHLGWAYDAIGAVRAGGAGFSWVESRLRKEDLHSLFCSELCAAGLRAIRRFPTANASRWSPNFLCRALVRQHVHGTPMRRR